MSKECTYTEYKGCQTVQVNQISLYGENVGCKELFHHIGCNLLLSFSLYLQIPFSPLYQRMSGILMSFNVGYGISGNSFITLFNVMHLSKIRLFFINSWKCCCGSHQYTWDLVRTHSIIIFILWGRNRNWGKSSDSPKTSQWRNQNSKPTLDSQFSALLKSLLYVNICVKYMVQKYISAVNQHLLLNLHGKTFSTLNILECCKECWGMQCSVANIIIPKINSVV